MTGQHLRYAGGCPLCTLKMKIEKSSHPLMELMVDNEGEEQKSFAKWINLIDQGGL